MNITSFKNDIKTFRLALPATVLAFAAFGSACEDETSKIGPSLTEGDINISIDTLYFDLGAKAVSNENYDSKTGNLLFGNIDVPEYGKLNCSFVSRMMCATSLDQLPDSLQSPERVDSCRLFLSIARGDLVGDSLTPQKVSVYELTKQLPSDITNSFNPEGYYDPSKCLGSKSFTVSYAGRPDSIATSKPTSGTNSNGQSVVQNAVIAIGIDLPKEYGVKIFEDYKNNPQIFQWPSTFSEYYPGYFVESSFGKGCVSNIYGLDLYIYGWYNAKQIVEKDTTWVHKPFYVSPLISSPEVLSSNNIKYKVSDNLKNMVANNESIITTPGGYNVSFRFPAEDLIRHYKKGEHNLSVISDLILTIPAETIDNNYGIGTAPTLMLIKTSELKDFFTNNKIPDNVTSFSAEYDSTNNRYRFSSMRSYILNLLNKGELTEEDVEFTIVPISLETEQGSYGNTTYITKCTPYTVKPTMTRLHTEKAMVVFTFSSQIIE